MSGITDKQEIGALIEEDAESFPPLHKMRLDGTYDEIRSLYLADERPWIVGYSGGKDSSAALQLVWLAISGLSEKERKKPLYVVSSDTMVENPFILDYLREQVTRMRTAAERDNLPFHIQMVRPRLSQTYWVNLIGRGYAAPTRLFRWCTDRLKIQPTSDYIMDRIAYHGEVIIVLGVRKGESATRDQVLSLRKSKRMHLYSHTTFSGAYVYAPIQDFSLEDVWGYLLQQPPPWGGDNYQLLGMYRTAQDNECPLVVDKSTPSCGNTRFGCWICTLVSSDRSMENLVDSGEEWMEDLLEIRDFLYDTTDPSKKREFRDYKHRDGRVFFKTDDDTTIARGPYYLHVSAKVLRMVLQAQKKLRSTHPEKDFTLITEDELHEIRRIWRNERGDWEDTVPSIYHEVMEYDLKWMKEDITRFGAEEESMLEKLCEASGTPLELVKKILDLESVMQGLPRRTSVTKSIDKIMSEEWRSEEEVLHEKGAGEQT